MKHRAARLLAAAVCGGLLTLAAAPAHALFDDNEARARIEQTNQRIDQIRKVLDERLTAVETQLRNQGLADLFTQIEQLKAEVAKLRGQLEVMTYELSEAQKRQRDLYVDLDSRMRKLETASAPPSSTAAAAAPGDVANVPGSAPGTTPTTGASFGPPPPAGSTGATGSLPPARTPADVAAEQRAYDAALDLFKSGNYGAAVQSFAAFVRNNPKSPLAPSAQYWIGNAQFALHDFRAAIASQRQLITNYPDSQKVPDALLNIATSQFELGDMTASRRTLEDLIARYPQSDAAAKARQRLASR
ncbi:MAG TPA: tol-pal system protein YbgF [Casimicrobiaceae bacterium]|nr:tol-pal system protein YbgF [Casimicrobiaceae bacterium]